MARWFGFLQLYLLFIPFLNTAAAVFSEAIKTSLNISTLSVTFAVSAFIAGGCVNSNSGRLFAWDDFYFDTLFHT